MQAAKAAISGIIGLLVSLAGYFPAHAAYFPVRNFVKKEYQAGTQNWDLTQNTGRFMYIANNEGLLEYNGEEWALYPISNHTNVRSVFYDSRTERIYAGAFNEFGYYSLDKRGNMVYTSLMENFRGISGISEIWKIIKAGENLYLQGDDRIFRYSGKHVHVYDVGGKVNCLASAGERVFVSSLEHGIMEIKGDSLEAIGGCREINGQKVCSILPYAGTGLLLTTEFDGTYIYDGMSVHRTGFRFDDKLKKAQVFCAASDGRHYAFGTVSDGVFIYDSESGTYFHVNVFSGLQNNSVLSLFFDMDSNLWLGLDKGIDHITLNSPEKKIFSNGKLFGTGYASELYEGRLYLGTNQGLYYMEYSPEMGGENRPYPVRGIRGQIWCLEEIDNTLFCGHDHGLSIIEGSRAIKIDGLGGIWKIEKCPFSPDDILGCSYNGLFILRKDPHGKWHPVQIKGFNEVSSTFEATPDGTIWFHHWVKGLFRLTVDTVKDSVTSVRYFSSADGFPTDRNNITNIYNGTIVFSSEGGFFIYDSGKDKVVPYEPFNRLFSRPPTAVKIEESPEGNLLFLSGTIQALSRLKNGQYELDSLSLKFLQEKRIPGFDDITWLDGGAFIINTEDGFSLIDTKKFENLESNPQSRVIIQSIAITDGKDSLVYGSRTPVPEQYGRNERKDSSDRCMLRLPYKDNSLKFEFACPQFSGNDAIQYRFMLENYDEKWSSWTKEPSKEYTGLPYGRYIFHVKARSSLYSAVSDTSFAFEIMPPWYMSKWAIAGYAAVIAFIVYLLARAVNEQTEKKAMEMEEKKEAEMLEQQKIFEEEAKKKEQEIVMLRNQTLENDLRHKSQDLANSTMNLIRKNEILIRIKNEVCKIQSDIQDSDSIPKNLRRLQKIQADIRENIGHDDDWHKFEHNFDSVYDNYLKRLKGVFPKLTAGDMRLCAYLKMNLSSKDIASMMNMSVRSVEMARYRLLQKLGLNRDNNLSDFLQNF